MTDERTTFFEADPASPEPSPARPGCCTGCGRSWEPEPAPDPVESDLRQLNWLTEMGMQLTEVKLSRARRLLESDDPRDGAADRSDLEFYRLSRAIRMTIVLKDRMRKERAGLVEEATVKQKTERQDRKERPQKQQVGQAIENPAQRSSGRPREDDAEADEHSVTDRRDALFETLSERLEQDDFERDLVLCSTGELVKRVCQDFGTEAAMALWRNSRWAREEAVRATPPAPVAPEPGPEAAEPPEPEPVAAATEDPKPPEAEPPRPEADDSASGRPEPPEPDNPHAARMKARLATALRSGAWLQALQMDPALTVYVRSRLIDSS